MKIWENYTITEATEDDLNLFMDHLKRASVETDFLIQYVDELETFDTEERQLVLGDIQNPRALLLVVKADDNIVGFASLEPMYPHGYRMTHRAIFGVSLEKAYWNRGIGTRLINECFDFARNNGIEEIELDVHAINDRAMSVYEKNGFVERFRNPKAMRNRDGSYYELVHMTRKM